MARASYVVALLAVTCLVASGNVFALSNVASFLNDEEPDNTAWKPDNAGNDGNSGQPSPPAPEAPTTPDTPATPSPSADSPPASTGACPGDPGYQEPWDSTFWDNFNIVTNDAHVRVSDNGDACDMQLDAECAAVFGSKHQYFTGVFSAKLQLPCGNSSGTVFAFYTSSDGKLDDHDEIDIELLGNETSKHITMQTNIFINGIGEREMRHNLDWFDPCTGHHGFFIKWNSNMVVVGVDDIPLRVHMNNEKNGLPFFNKGQGLYVSYWDGSSWATQGGRIKIDYEMNAPFIANMNGFHHMQACQVPSERNLGSCQNPAQTPCWDKPSEHYLTDKQKTDFEWANTNFCTYDYCKDDERFAATGKPAECNIPLY